MNHMSNLKWEIFYSLRPVYSSIWILNVQQIEIVNIYDWFSGAVSECFMLDWMAVSGTFWLENWNLIIFRA